MIRLVAFLGNYGRTYENTRHNAAWLFADSLPFAHRLSWQHKFKGAFCSLDASRLASWAAEYQLGTSNAQTASDAIYFLKPETYMNASGESIGELANFYKLTADHILVVHDELELPAGTISLKKGGGLGGHNGLRSTKAVLNTADFWRFRFGIGRPDNPDVAGYVLSPFTSDERITMAQTFSAAAIPFTEAILSNDPAKLVAAWGKKKVSAD
ncbi:aminoacyl-tRNA hydrolase [Treponema sp. Marseille-Q4523]|uniref:aminoacyl-tRNA hydrolase n=1 Tax=Treponema sp. Marseille-Q4523 TaxID=2810610 RepID=UPI001961E556|nr:aminoacyl-tRNA hydrolase [Treponema sp. Marseille-Q4523]MBM7023745.1 aminoacyl-tRNA hydrolase [Treponema sp. Marseille-Q4523]